MICSQLPVPEQGFQLRDIHINLQALLFAADRGAGIVCRPLVALLQLAHWLAPSRLKW